MGSDLCFQLVKNVFSHHIPDYTPAGDSQTAYNFFDKLFWRGGGGKVEVGNFREWLIRAHQWLLQSVLLAVDVGAIGLAFAISSMFIICDPLNNFYCHLEEENICGHCQLEVDQLPATNYPGFKTEEIVGGGAPSALLSC